MPPFTLPCGEHSLTRKGAPHAKKSKDISVFALRFEPLTEFEALDCTFVRALVYMLVFFFCFAFLSSASVLYFNFYACKDVTWCCSATLKSSWTKYGLCCSLWGICGSISSAQNNWIPCTEFFAKSIIKIFRRVSFFFFFWNTSDVCINKQNILLWFRSC